MFISRVLRSKAIWFGLILCFDASAAPRLAESVVNSYQETASVEQTLMWRWRDSIQTTYQVRYKLDGAFKQVAVDGTQFGQSKSQLMQLQWVVPHGAGEITLQQYRLKKLVSESESVSPPVIAAKLDEHAGHMGHASHNHVPPGEATKWMFTESRAKSGADEPNINPAIPYGSCPVGATNGPFGQSSPSDCGGPQSKGDPISVTDGSFWLRIPCFSLGGAGRPISFSLHYDTHKVVDELGYTGIGLGWAGSYQRRLTITPDWIYFIQGDGSYHWWSNSANNTYTSQPNNYAKLSLNSTLQEYTVTYQSGELDVFDSSGLLKRATDRVGNSTVISAFTIGSDGTGRRILTNSVSNQSIVLEHQLVNVTAVGGAISQIWKLTRVTESGTGIVNPRQMIFTYGTLGNDANKLIKITDAASRTYTFNYDAISRIVKYWDPLNDPALNSNAIPTENEYFGPSQHAKYDMLMVSQQTRGNTRLVVDFNSYGFQADDPVMIPGTSSTYPYGLAYTYRKKFNYQTKISGAFVNMRTEGFVIGAMRYTGQQIVVREFAPTSPANSGYDPRNPPSNVTYKQYYYDGPGNLTRELLVNGNYAPDTGRIDYFYGTNGLLTSTNTYTAAGTYSTTQFQHNSFGQTTQIIEPSGTINNMSYNAVTGLLTSTARVGVIAGEPISQTTTIAYSPVTINGLNVLAGLPTAVTLPDGTVNTQTYDSLGYPSVSTFDAGSGRLNITESTTFDARGNLIAMVDKRGIRSTLEYTNNPANGQYGNLGVATANVYDTQGVNGLPARNIRTESYFDAMLNPTRVVNDAGAGRKNATNLASYAPVGFEGGYAPTQVTDPINRVMRMEYDGMGQLSKLLQVGARGSSFNDSLITCTGTTEARGSVADRVVRFCYTPEGWSQKTIFDDGRSGSSIDYAGFGDGLPRSITDARGVRTTLQYDGKGRLVKTISGTAGFREDSANLPAINGETIYSYDSNDRALSVIAMLASGTRTLVSNQYDGLGRLSQTIDGAGNQTRYSYDIQRNFLLTSISGANTSAESVSVQNSFDRLGRLLTSRTDPSGKNLTTAYGYAPNGDRWLANAITNPRGKTTRYAYNSLGSLQSVTDPVGSVWNYSTNNLGDLTQVDVPGIGANTDYNVNVIGQILSLTRNGQTENWIYNVDGSVQRYVDFSGQFVYRDYDVVGRLKTVDFSGTASDPNGSRSDMDNITYWPNGLVQSVSSRPDGTKQEETYYTYDAANRLIGATRNGRKVGYAYNLDNTLSQINYWTRGAVSYGYGANGENNGLVRSVTPFDRAASSYTYTSANQLSRVQRPSPNGMLSQFGYDRAARLTSIDHTGNSALVHSAAYELDNNGNRTKLTENYPAAGTASAQTASQHFGYDELDRLIRAEYGAIGSTPKREESFLYDAVGNRTSVQQTTMQNTSDFDQDGTPDLAWRLYDNNVGANSIWVMGGANGDQYVRGVTSATPVPGAGSANWWQLTGDINGDGVNELLWRNMGSGSNVYWKLGGADNYVLQANGPILNTNGAELPVAGADWVQEAVADMNRDGKGDIIWRNYNTGQNVVWLMGGGSNGQQALGFADLPSVPVNTALYNFRLEAAADFNRDGFTDLAWHDLLGGAVIIWYMGPDPITGNGTKIVEQVQPSFNGTTVTVPTGVNNLRMRGAADANKDGTPDLYWQYGGTGEIIIWYMADSGKKVGSFSSLAPRPPSPWWIAKGSQYARLTSENKLSFDASDRITSPGYSFDTNGNVTASPAIIGQTATTYTYTAANKLLRTVKDGVTTEYQYDGSGNLIRKIRAGITTDYVLDENRGLANVIGEITGSDDILYAFGPEGLHAQQRKLGSTLIAEYPLSDGLGSIKAITNNLGGVNRTESFDAWGVKRSGSGVGASAFGFTGEQGMEDGTTYLRARSYLPAMGRFLQRDTFAGFSGRPQSLNRYAYVEGNPTGLVDPSGMLMAAPILAGPSFPDSLIPESKNNNELQAGAVDGFMNPAPVTIFGGDGILTSPCRTLRFRVAQAIARLASQAMQPGVGAVKSPGRGPASIARPPRAFPGTPEAPPLSNKLKGIQGEQAAGADVNRRAREAGGDPWSPPFRQGIQNNSGHGVDGVTELPSGGVSPVEVKANQSQLSPAQRQGGNSYARDRLRRAETGLGPYSNVPNAERQRAADYGQRLSGQGEVIRVEVDAKSGAARVRSVKPWTPR